MHGTDLRCHKGSHSCELGRLQTGKFVSPDGHICVLCQVKTIMTSKVKVTCICSKLAHDSSWTFGSFLIAVQAALQQFDHNIVATRPVDELCPLDEGQALCQEYIIWNR